MPVDPPLTRAERDVLTAIMRHGADVQDCTPMALAQATRLDVREVSRALRTLERRDPPLVRSDVDLGLGGVRFYRSTYDAVEATEER
jgi:DNA-binding MarR family transcriptional regulator